MQRHIRFITILLGLLALLAAATVHADTIESTGRIPFGFTAGDVTFAPGTYTITRANASPSVLLVRGEKQNVMLSTHGGGSSASQDRSRLVFYRYGSQYFLREIWLMGKNPNTLRETDAERASAAELRRQAQLPVIVIVEATFNQLPRISRARPRSAAKD